MITPQNRLTRRRRWVSRLSTVALLISFVSAPSVLAAIPDHTNHTILGVADAHFTLNNRPAFLLGFSYYAGLGAPEDFIRQDLSELQAYGFNWLRLWATWGAYETNISAVTAAGLSREPYLTRLKSLVGECDRLGLVVDVTLTRGKELTGHNEHLTAVDTLVTALKPFRNWYLDLGNERDVRDARYVSLAELKQLREKVLVLDPKRLVTASFGGHDLTLADVRGALEEAGVDFLCPHRPRHRESPGETEAETRKTLGLLKQVGRAVPVHYQEPFRRGYTSWEPVAADFLTDLRGALRGGAAGWCFHNGGQRTKPDAEPRRSFDLRANRLLDQLDEEEMNVVRSVKSLLADHQRKIPEKTAGRMKQTHDNLNQQVKAVARKDVATLQEDLTVQQALNAIRERGVGEKIVYFYVVDHRDRLAGVLPTRRLLTASLDKRLSEIMVRHVVAIPETATVLEACEAFVLHKFLAFPVVDYRRQVVGVLDVDVFTNQVFDIAETERLDELFEAIGFHVSQVRDASPLRAFRFRFPWLLATIGSGTICALLAGAYEVTLAKSLVLAFFLTMVLGLGESVSIQSMTITIQALRTMKPTFGWYLQAFWRELGTSFLLGTACGTVVGIIVWLWRGAALAALSIGASILLTLCAACFWGLTVPAVLHAFKLDPKIAAGPVTLAFTDIFTLLFYFSLGALLL